jgi:hypothetical protein
VLDLRRRKRFALSFDRTRESGKEKELFQRV